MSASKPRRRAPFVPPKDWLLGKVVLVGDDYCVEVANKRGVKKVFNVGRRQTWNWNVALGMELYVTVEKNTCTIRRRVHQNKQFVQI